MHRVYNFSAGPAALPESVLKQTANEMLDYKGSGMSVMELSHRSAIFQEIIDAAEEKLRNLMRIPDNYHVLFLQGGASLQFAMIPMNIMKNGRADFINTGAWTKKAITEAKKFGDVNIAASSEDKNFRCIPDTSAASFDPDASYLHIAVNNTIFGTRYSKLPDSPAPLVADMSSNILSQQYDVNDFGIIFAGAQKNMGPAGVTVVIIRNDLVGLAGEKTPTMLNYKTHVEKKSMFNTPPTYNIYMLKLVLEWLEKKGGVAEIEKINKSKAAMLYDFLDNSDMFKATVESEKDRSIMNVTFMTDSRETDEKFIKEAAQKGLVNLKGHRSAGGMRASIYNAMPVEGVQKLIKFMKKFETENS